MADFYEDYDRDDDKARSMVKNTDVIADPSTPKNVFKNEGNPNQLALLLFELENSEFSNTIDVYDAIPKYTHSDRRTKDLSTAETVRHFKMNNAECKVIIKPAIIKDKDGSNVLVYPGIREELVESVLRKLAVDGQGKAVDQEIGVVFTMYQVYHELKTRKHAFAMHEIKEAIMVLRGATLECSSSSGETVISSSFFPTVILVNKDEIKKDSRSKCFVMFNPLVTRSILNLTYRSYNYVTNMLMNSPLARFLHKRMSHNFKQASVYNAYTINLVSFLKASERGLSKRMPENVRAMKNALECLIKHNIVESYVAEKITKGPSTIDVKYTIYPHPNFVSEVIQANKTQKQNNLNSMKMSVSE